MRIELTNEMILDDIKRFEQRIKDARNKLAALPKTAETWHTRKKLKEKKRILLSEINHVKRLIGIAEEALTEV